MQKVKTYVYTISAISLLLLSTSCKSSAYPCPKNSSKRAANISDRNDSAATPNTSKGKSSKKDNGLIKKKEPKRIHKKR